jgi:hypothetical protein
VQNKALGRALVSARQAAILGGAVGLAVSAVILVLLWWGVAGILFVGNVDLASLFWPSFFLLTTNWHSSVPGAAITLCAIAINCLIYALLALAVWAAVRSIFGWWSRRGA